MLGRFRKLQITVICTCLRQLSQRRFRFIAVEYIAMREIPGREGGREKLKERLEKKARVIYGSS